MSWPGAALSFAAPGSGSGSDQARARCRALAWQVPRYHQTTAQRAMDAAPKEEFCP